MKVQLAFDLGVPWFPINVRPQRMSFQDFDEKSPIEEGPLRGMQHVNKVTLYRMTRVSDKPEEKITTAAYGVVLRAQEFMRGKWTDVENRARPLTEIVDVESLGLHAPDVSFLKSGHALNRTEIELGAAFMRIGPCFVGVMAADEIVGYIQDHDKRTPGVRCAIVNTVRNNTASGGVHWVVVVWDRPRRRVKVKIADPLSSTACCKTILSLLTQASIPVAATATRFQNDGWRCGYYALFICWRIARSSAGSIRDVTIIKMPPTFTSTVWSGVAAQLTWMRGTKPAISEDEAEALAACHTQDVRLE